MTKLYAENILIGSLWQSDKTLCLDQQGVITSIIDGKDPAAELLAGTVIPGMPNCHSHAFQRAFSGYSEYRGFDNKGIPSKDSFWSWRDIMYRFVAKMTPEDLHVVAKFLYIEMLKTGYTSVAEFHYLHHQVAGISYDDPAEMSHQVINAAKQVGIAMTHLPVLYSYAGFGEQSPTDPQARFIHSTEDYLRLVEQLHKNYAGQPCLQLGIAPHSLRAVSQQQLLTVVPHIRKLNPQAPIHIHIAEQIQEVNDCLKFYHKRPVEWLLENHSMDSNWCLIHATHLSQAELTALGKSQAIAGICPTTEANLGDGIFETESFLAQNGRIAIGSDSHIAVNLADELRWLEYAQRLTSHQRAVLVEPSCPSVGQSIYTRAALGGALALSQNIGELVVGKRADLVVLDLEHPSLYCKQNHQILDAAIFASSQLPVKDVFVAGRKLIDDGEHPMQTQVNADYKAVLKKLI